MSSQVELAARRCKGHAQAVMSVAMSSDGKHIASGGGDNTLRFWDAVAGQPLGSPLDNHTAPVSSVAFSSDGRTVVSASLDKAPRFSDAPSAWAERVCARVVRNLSRAEWTRHVGEVDYVVQCPGYPCHPTDSESAKVSCLERGMLE
jgi:WD40 repeat protein